jgi:hypothetical protein
MNSEFSRKIFEKSLNIKFHENPSRASRDIPCGQTDGRKDRANLRLLQFCEHGYTHFRTHLFVHYCTLFLFWCENKIALEVWPSILVTSSIFAQQPFHDVRVCLCFCLGSAVCWGHILVFCMWLQEFPISLLLTDNTECCNQKMCV